MPEDPQEIEVWLTERELDLVRQALEAYRKQANSHQMAANAVVLTKLNMKTRCGLLDLMTLERAS